MTFEKKSKFRFKTIRSLLGLFVVALNQTVKEVKNKSPKHSEQDKVSAIKALSEVTTVSTGYIDNKYRIIEEIKPDIIALGYDQQAFTEKLEAEITKRGLSCEARCF